MQFNPNHFSEFPNGVYTVLVTPFYEDGSINYSKIQNWVCEQLDSDVAGIVLNGTTSENPTLSDDEKWKITACVGATYDLYYSNTKNLYRLPKFICMGVGSNCTSSTIEFALLYKDRCHGFMVVTPYYNKPQQRGLVEHYKSIANHPYLNKKMILLYNVPGRTGVNCLPETIKMIVDSCPNVKGVKEASGNPEQAKKIIELCKGTQLKVFSGDDKLVLDMLKVGAVGLISVASNVFPELFCSFVDGYLGYNDNYTGSDKDNEQFLDESFKEIYKEYHIAELCDALFCETNPVAVKRMMKLSGRYSSDSVRLPLVSLDPKFDDLVKQTYEKVKKVVGTEFVSINF